MENILQNTEPRIYQQVIFSECVSSNANTLVVLPTGLGKTVIMAYLCAYSLNKSPDKQVLILTPTRPLVHQIKLMFSDFIGNIIQIRDIVEINKVDELIFCAKDMTSQSIIKTMLQFTDKNIDFKIAPPESLSVIGSNSINTAGNGLEQCPRGPRAW